MNLLKWQSWLVLVVFLSLLTSCTFIPFAQSTRTLTRDLQNKVKQYRVKPGDTLYSVGFRSGYGYHRLAQWNRIKLPYTIKAGQILKLYPPTNARSPQKTVKKRRPRLQKKLTFPKHKTKPLRLYWQWPVNGKLLKNFYANGKKGIDIIGRYGQPVKAAAAGKVVYSGNGLIGYGNLLIIKHNTIYLSAYANNWRLLVKEGQYVKKGQIIGEIGRTKNQSAVLHFEIRKYGKPVNPTRLLPKR